MQVAGEPGLEANGRPVAEGTLPANGAPPPPEAQPDEPSPHPSHGPGRWRRAGWWLDVVLFLVLFLAALPVRWNAAVGDLWMDEADYAQAATRGFHANRWDISPLPDKPDTLIRLRHYHPPFVAQVIGAAFHWGTDDRTVRIPFMLAGALSVAFVYLCGLAIFRGLVEPPPGSRAGPFQYPLRSAALACAVIVMFTSPQVRAGSHALPWAWITLWLLAQLWTLLKYVETRSVAWVTAAWLPLAGMFITSEYFFPAGLALVVSLPIVLWADFRNRKGWGWLKLIGAFLLGAALFAGIAWVFWPEGLQGGAYKLFHYYANMSDDTSFPVVIEGITYERAPKWSYLYWYMELYPALTLFYGLGLLTLLAAMLNGSLRARFGVLLAFLAVVLFVAHRAHIIGPQYLAHALPLLTLVGGILFVAFNRVNPLLGMLATVAGCAAILVTPEPQPLDGMEPRSQHPRWTAAAQFLAKEWKPGDRMLATSFGVSARWYLRNVGHAPVEDREIRILPPNNAPESLYCELAAGDYRFVAVGNTFMDWTQVDQVVRRQLRTWPVVWESDEAGTGRSRLVIYERPDRYFVGPPTPLQQRRLGR